VRLADTRDVRCDVAFTLELMSDFAVGSLRERPGVAEAALDRIEEVLARIGPRPFPSGRYGDKHGRLRILQPVLSWPRLTEIALGDLAARSCEDPSVRERLSALVDALARRVAPERAAALAAYAPFPRFTHPVEQRIAVVDAERVPGDAGAR
jgi:uncharacterized membrane protein